MASIKNLSVSKASKKSLSVQSKALPTKTVKKLSEASQIANRNIAHNDLIYTASNSHASDHLIQ